jgi:hypothetical protein
MEESKAVVQNSMIARGMDNVAEINVYAMKGGQHLPIRMVQMLCMLHSTALLEIVPQVKVSISYTKI